MIARGGYLLAGLHAATPLFLHLPVVTGSQPGLADPVSRVAQAGVALMALVFLDLGAVIAGVAALIDDTESTAERNL